MIEYETTKANNVVINEVTITVDLEDGGMVSAPIVWFPRLTHANEKVRNNWRFIGAGEGIR